MSAFKMRFRVAATMLGVLTLIVVLANCQDRETPPAGEAGSQSGESLVVLDYGPKSATVGRGFQVQPDGKSAMWFKVEGGSEPMTVVFAGENLKGFWDAETGVVTVALGEDKLAKEGRHEIRLCHPPKELCSAPIYFEVLPRAETVTVLDYGPKSVTAGRGFQVQPDGRSAMWFKVKDGREPMTVVFAGENLRGHWNPETGFVTVSLDADKLAKEGTREIKLCNLPEDVCSAPIHLRVLPPG